MSDKYSTATYNFREKYMTTEINRLAKRSDLHILRKLWHISFGSTCLGLYFAFEMDINFWGYFAICAAFLGFLNDLLRLNNKKYNSLCIKYMGAFMRKSEEDGFSGLPFYALGVGLSILFYQTDIALISIFFLVFADPIASFVGINYGKDKILPNKSLQGTIAAFFVCYLISMVYLQDLNVSSINMMTFAILGGVVGSLSELASAFHIDDNLTIPVISGGGLSVINYFFNLF